MNKISNPTKPCVLIVDDEASILDVISQMVTVSGFKAICAASAIQASEMMRTRKPDIILLDIQMPAMNGYEFCRIIRENKAYALIPVIFFSVFHEEQDKAKAFAAGGNDFLEKPIEKEKLIATLRKHLETKEQWNQLAKEPVPEEERMPGAFDFKKFLEFLLGKLNPTEEQKEKIHKLKRREIFTLVEILGIKSVSLAQYMAEFCALQYFSQINAESIQLDLLPAPFCRENLIVPIQNVAGKTVFVMPNPFDFELVQLLKTRFEKAPFDLAVADRNTINFLLSNIDMGRRAVVGAEESVGETAQTVTRMANSLLFSAVSERASDIHIEPKENNVVIRLRVDGEMRELYTISKEIGLRLISRFKVLGGMDIAERRKPQDGVLETSIDKRAYKLRLATTSTPSGESMIVRLLDYSSKPKKLDQLGMTREQAEMLMSLAGQSRGLILIVGPTGCGKTTTIYSLLSQIDCQTRSLVSVEDPVEYPIAFANQQQVNEKAGLTLEAVLKSAVRQDPDILFLGEIRDPFSAKAALDFASTGHLTIASVHTTNATTVIFRLERLGLVRSAMADTLLGIVAQRLLRVLCAHCKKVGPPTPEEVAILAPFTDTIPAQVARPVGCLQCDHTGYYGREGVYEVIANEAAIAEMIRTNEPISKIREFIWRNNGYLISHHVVEKVGQLLFSPRDAYEQVLIEELDVALAKKQPPRVVEPAAAPAPAPARETAVAAAAARPVQRSILVVDDDKDISALIVRYLENQGYEVTVAEDGVAALLQLGRRRFDLILSDINMPNLDGFKLLEIINQKGIHAPVIFLTGMTAQEDEMKGLELGAVDYLRKPVQKNILLHRVKNVLEKM